MKQASPKSLSKIALAGGLVAATGGAAHAAVILTSTSSFTFPASSPDGANLQFNLTTGAFGFNNTAVNPQFTINFDGGNNAKARLVGVSSTTGVLFAGTDKTVNVPVGNQISASSGTYRYSAANTYLGFNQDDTSQFRYGTTGYAALTIPDPVVAGRVNYGYAQISYNTDHSVTVSGLAYENTGAPITVVPIVPEPGTVATSLLALGGAAGAMVARRRRAAKDMAA